MENKQLKSEDFIGKWVTCKGWDTDSYILIKEIIKKRDDFYFGLFLKNKGIRNTRKPLVDHWLIYNLSDLKIVSEAEVAKKAIEYGHDLRELGLHQFISVNKVTKEDLYNTKIWIGNNESLSRKVQKRLFELGFGWFDSGKNLFLNCKAIFLFSDKDLSRIEDDTFKNFKCHKHREITLSDLGLEETVIDYNEFYNQPIEIIPVIKTIDINIPNIILTNNKLTI